MIVTAEDLATAQRYPVSLLQTVLRAYFGCGVVCGLGLHEKPHAEDQPGWVLRVDAGVAIDCDGYPVELCGPVELDLSPEACSCEKPAPKVYILIRRVTSDESAAEPCSCCCPSDTEAPRFDCRRTREAALVQAFSEEDLEALRVKVCRRAPAGKNASLCDAWTTCPSCGCEESWILLGSVALNERTGIDADPDLSERPWVSPLEALCATVEKRLTALEGQIAGPAKPVPEPPAGDAPPADHG
jgi:hypothetical protein